MRVFNLIEKKKKGEELNRRELEYLINGFADSSIPDYQMSSFLMAVNFNSMSFEELTNFTNLLIDSGDSVEFKNINENIMDLHSTGGVGDKTTLVVAPLVASLGITVAKTSGRILGYTGGTIDKLQSIPGFEPYLSMDDFVKKVEKNKLVVAAILKNMVPVEKKIYELRNATATVDSIPLIASSIMSKKIAGGADYIVLDVKLGSGAFMKTYDDAHKLAKTMVDLGTNAGKKVIALISDMNQPLGNSIGNLLEVKEAVKTLSGKGSADLEELSIELASRIVQASGTDLSYRKIKSSLINNIDNGQALEKFIEMVENQGGDPEFIRNLVNRDEALEGIDILYDGEDEAYVKSIDAMEIGLAAMQSGSGRERICEKINSEAGIILHKKVGDHVEKGIKLATIFTENKKEIEEIREKIQNSYKYSSRIPGLQPLIYSLVTPEKTVKYEMIYS